MARRPITVVPLLVATILLAPFGFAGGPNSCQRRRDRELESRKSPLIV